MEVFMYFMSNSWVSHCTAAAAAAAAQVIGLKNTIFSSVRKPW